MEPESISNGKRVDEGLIHDRNAGIDVQVSLAPSDEGGAVEVLASDHGEGMAAGATNGSEGAIGEDLVQDTAPNENQALSMEEEKDVGNTERADERLARGESAGLGVQTSLGLHDEGEVGEVSAVGRAESMVAEAMDRRVTHDTPAENAGTSYHMYAFDEH
ncbi:hypothetical protein EIP86_004730 [Pleurotus ostreatoroseus]|nr:hypothetical protein EIP86_004730 [Pleurotus ostreatoroseus]